MSMIELSRDGVCIGFLVAEGESWSAADPDRWWLERFSSVGDAVLRLLRDQEGQS